MPNKIALKIGGSLISRSVGEVIDWAYLYQVADFVKRLVLDDYLVLLSVGGGAINRYYNQNLPAASSDTLHRIGMSVTVTHAHILYALVEDIAINPVITGEDYKNLSGIDWDQAGAVVGASSELGHTNEYNAVQLAVTAGVERLYILKDVDGIYTSDPDENSDAELIPKLSWKEYFELFGITEDSTHQPGANYPIGPISAKLAAEQGLELFFLGADLQNLVSAVNLEEALGTKVGG